MNNGIVGLLTNSAASNASWTGNVSLSNSGSGIRAGGATHEITLSGDVSGAGTVQAEGLLLLSGTNSHTGNTLARDNSVLRLGSASALGTAAAGTFVQTGATLDLNGQAISGEGITLQFNNARLVNNSGTAASASGNVAFASSLTGLEIGGSGQLTVSGVVSGSSAFSKTGAGTLRFTGANTNTGQTIVSAGSLLINGTQTEASPVAGQGYGSVSTGHYQIANGALLGGSGRIAGNTSSANSNMVLVESGGVLAPGDGVGTLTLDGLNIGGAGSTVLRMNAGATFQVQLSGSGGLSDRISFWNYATGDLALNNNAIDLTLSGPLSAGNYMVTIIDFFSDNGTTSTTSGITSGLTIGSVGAGFSGTPTIGYNSGAGTISISYTVVPEPGTLGLLLAGGLILGGGFIRRLAKAAR